MCKNEQHRSFFRNNFQKQPALGWHMTRKLKNVYFSWPCHHCHNTIGNTTTDLYIQLIWIWESLKLKLESERQMYKFISCLSKLISIFFISHPRGDSFSTGFALLDLKDTIKRIPSKHFCIFQLHCMTCCFEIEKTWT